MAYAVSKISSKGQLTISKELRSKHGLKAGEQVMQISGIEGILIRKASANPRGFLKNKLDSQGIEDEIRKLREQWKP